MEQQLLALIAYFKSDLPKIFSIPGAVITDCRKFIATQFIRMEHGAPIIKQMSYDHLVALRNALQKQHDNCEPLYLMGTTYVMEGNE